MAKKLYVGNLSFSVTDSSLQDIFSQVGQVLSAKVISDRMTGRSRGFGFVEMADDSAASEAIERLNGKDFDGRRITVNEARPEAPRNGGGGGYGGGSRARY